MSSPQVSIRKYTILGPVALGVACLLVVTGIWALSANLKSGNPTFRDELTGISFEYPRKYTVTSRHETLGGARLLELRFEDGSVDTDGLPKYGGLTIIKLIPKKPSESFEYAIRRLWNDRNGLLIMRQCDVGRTASPCLEIVEQLAWQRNGGGTQINHTINIDGGTAIHSIVPSQIDTLDTTDAREEVIRTLKFAPSSTE